MRMREAAASFDDVPPGHQHKGAARADDDNNGWDARLATLAGHMRVPPFQANIPPISISVLPSTRLWPSGYMANAVAYGLTDEWHFPPAGPILLALAHCLRGQLATQGKSSSDKFDFGLFARDSLLLLPMATKRQKYKFLSFIITSNCG